MRRNKFKTRRRFERLEDRRMMTGNDLISDNDNVVTVLGTGNDDEIVIAADPEHSNKVLITVKDRATGEILDDYDNEFEDVDNVIVLAGDGDDIVTNITNVPTEMSGEGGNDTLTGGSNIDILTGGTGNDILTGNGGNDTYVYRGRNVGSDEIQEAPNVDTDTLDFSGFDTFVSVDLERVNSPSNPTNFLATGFMTNLQLKQSNPTGLENVTGSTLTDTIRGNARPNHFWGGDEDDKLEGRGGNDILEGEAGSDRYDFGGTSLGTDEIRGEAADSDDDLLSFRGMSSGVTVDISKAGSEFAVDSADLKLILANDTAIERVFGSNYRDIITGNRRNNTLKGFDGNDTILGGIGADILDGGADTDTFKGTDALDQVFGGTGRDWFDGLLETFGSSNPRPGRYMDWGTL